MKILPPEAILSRLEHALSLLAGTAVDVPARQRTLRGAIDWSVRLLEPDEQSMFTRLSVFSGGWTLEAAMQVAAPDEAFEMDVLDQLTVLVDQSLVRSTADGDHAEPQFDMLQLIREYGLEQLAALDEAMSVGRRHAVWMLGIVEMAAPAMEAGTDLAWSDRLSVEHDNMRAALRWCVEQGEREMGLRLATAAWQFWQQRGHTVEGRAWFDRLLTAEAEEAVDPGVVAAAHTALGGLAYWQGDLDGTDLHYQAAIELDRQLGRSDRLGNDVYNLAFAAMARREVDRARQLFDESMELFTAAGQLDRLADTTSARGAIELRSGNAEAARQWVERGRALQLAQGNRLRATDAATVLSQIEMQLGNLAGSRNWLLIAMQESRDIGDLGRWPLVLEIAAALALAVDRPRNALLFSSAAVRVRGKLGGGPPAFFALTGGVDSRARAAVEERLGAEALGQIVAESDGLDDEALIAMVHAPETFQAGATMS